MGVRPARKGLPLKLAGRGQAAARNRRAAKSPEARTRVLRRRAERREALPWPLFLGDPGNKLRSLHYKVRLSALRLPSKGGEKTKAKLARWRGNEVAWLFEI